MEQARDACRQALEHSSDLAPLWQARCGGQPALQEGRALLPRVRTSSDAVPRLGRIKESLLRDGVPVGGGAFERFLIVAAALESIDRLPGLPLDHRVRELFCQNFRAYAATPEKLPEPFDLSRASFITMGRIATLSRFTPG